MKINNEQLMKRRGLSFESETDMPLEVFRAWQESR